MMANQFGMGATKILVRDWLLGQFRKAQDKEGSNAVSKLKRQLGDDFQKVFPRSGLDLAESSFGRRNRVELLPHNRIFLNRVREARNWLGIPDGLFEVTDRVRAAVEMRRRRERTGLLKAGAMDIPAIQYSDVEMRTDLLVTWFAAYRNERLPIERFPDVGDFRLLRTSARNAGAAWHRLDSRPDWFLVPPRPDRSDPVADVASALCEIHLLPDRFRRAVERFVVTGDRRDVENLAVFDISVRPEIEHGKTNGFTIKVSGVDGHTSLTDLAGAIVEKAGAATDSLTRERGLMKQQRPAITSQDYIDVMPIFDLVEAEGLTVSEAMRKLVLPGIQLLTAKRRIRELKKFLNPLFGEDR